MASCRSLLSNAVRACTNHSALRGLFTAVLVMAFAVTNARAENWFVEVGGSQLAFAPMTLNINPGDTVTFLNLGGLHNVVADDGSFRCAHGCDGDGKGGNGSPSNVIWSATVAFPKSGSIGYFCETHGAPGVGMYGTIKVHAAPPPPPPPAQVSGVPSGGVKFGGLLAAALIVLAGLRLRRSALARRSIRRADDTQPRNFR